jgi:hypothetical protein
MAEKESFDTMVGTPFAISDPKIAFEVAAMKSRKMGWGSRGLDLPSRLPLGTTTADPRPSAKDDN